MHELLHTLWLINPIYRLVFRERERERERERGGVGGEVGLGREVGQLVIYIYIFQNGKGGKWRLHEK
jgi:hypothetical protein